MKRKIHNGKIRRGNSQKENRITANNFLHNTLYHGFEDEYYAEVKCPLCNYVNTIKVSDEKQIEFICNCGVKLRFSVLNQRNCSRCLD